MSFFKEIKYPLLWMLTGAMLTGFILVFPTLGMLQWLTMIPIMLGVYKLCFFQNTKLIKAYGCGFLTIFAYYFVLYHWMLELYPLDFVDGMDKGSALVVVLAGWIGLSLLQAILGGFLFLFYRILAKGKLLQSNPILRPLTFAALWVVFEFSSTLGWTGVPWGRLALGQVKMLPMLQSASLFGSYFVSFLIVLVNALLAYAILAPKRRVCSVAMALSLLFANLGYGLIAQNTMQRTDGEQVDVAVIQGNINSHEKWSGDSYIIKQAYGPQTEAAAAEGAQLIVWPESTFPQVINQNQNIRNFITDLAKTTQSTMLVGASWYDNGSYNVVVQIDPNGKMQENFYAKRHLVPFGEYVPMRDVIMTLIPPLANISMLDSDVIPGEGSELFDTEWGKIGALICFDSIYEQLTIDSVRDGAELLIISSNDSWFYDSVGVYMHRAQAQLRAVESGRYVVRAANTGISAVIAPNGELMAEIDPLVQGYAVESVAMRSQNTLYTIVGNLFVYLCALFCLFCMVADMLFSFKTRKIK